MLESCLVYLELGTEPRASCVQALSKHSTSWTISLALFYFRGLGNIRSHYIVQAVFQLAILLPQMGSFLPGFSFPIWIGGSDSTEWQLFNQWLAVPAGLPLLGPTTLSLVPADCQQVNLMETDAVPT